MQECDSNVRIPTKLGSQLYHIMDKVFQEIPRGYDKKGGNSGR